MFFTNLHRHREALEARMAFVVNWSAGGQGAAMGVAAIRVTKADVLKRRLKGVADGIVVGSNQRRRLTTVDK